jgi:pimeloyl-ACP methyl ester carboxylesterase
MRKRPERHFPAVLDLQCNGLTFPVVSWGREGDRPIILLHGFPQEPFTWEPVAQALAESEFQVFAPVQRGYAASTRPEENIRYLFSVFAQDVVEFANALTLTSFDVVGFGMGGAQAWMAAAQHPTRIRSLTSLRFPHPAAFAQGTRSDPEQRDRWRRLDTELGTGSPAERASALLADNAAGLRQFLAVVGLPQPHLDRYVLRLEEPGVLAGALSWEYAVSLDEFSRVPAVTVPTLFIWSEGPGVTRTTAEATRAYVHARYSHCTIPDVGNFILEKAPTAVIEPLRSHLQLT